MKKQTEDKKLEFIEDNLSADRPNRLCVSLSDLHLTDGSVGFQNLGIHTWTAFYDGIVARCKRYNIKEFTFVLDGDVVDMIRTDKWARKGVYPWQRDKEEFSQIVNKLIRDIVDIQHKEFFDWLKGLPTKLEDIVGVKTKIVVLLGNHDKELLCDQNALSYFYEHGLGRPLDSIDDDERREIGRMYGDEEKFIDKTTAPYFPFYYGDTGFRFFTTHGHWRDKENSRKVKAKNGLPSWSTKDGWAIEAWKKLKFSPFFLPCFGDSVAAGVLSTFIYKTKKQLKECGHDDDRLNSILDELDLYRPTYKAVTRILKEARSMRKENCGHEAIKIIESTLYNCIMDWLSWNFTYETSPLLRRILLTVVKLILKIMKFFNVGLEIKTIAVLVKHLMPAQKEDLTLKEMKGFPAFLPEYEHYGFQIHGEGHTHVPWEEDPNFYRKKPSTYINFGTWRDQIVGRKNIGFRRRSILRAFFILDLKDETKGAEEGARSFNYYTDDIISWSDKSDSFSRKGPHQPHL